MKWVKVTQSCPTLRPHGLYSLWNSPGRNTGVGSCSHSPGDFLNPGIEPRSPLLQVDSLPAELKGSPRIPEWVVYPFSRGSSQPRNRTQVSSTAGKFCTVWATRILLVTILTITPKTIQRSTVKSLFHSSFWWVCMASGKMIPMNPFAGQQWRCRHRKLNCGHSRGMRGE